VQGQRLPGSRARDGSHAAREIRRRRGLAPVQTDARRKQQGPAILTATGSATSFQKG
jgi:hypothetical protein